MKNIYSLLLLIFLVSCGGKNTQKSFEKIKSSNNLEQIKAKKKELDAKQQKLADQIKILNAKISKLDTSKKIPLITTFIAKENPFMHYLELQGNVQTKQNVLIYPEMAGQLSNVYVKEGQQVVKGQELGKIDDGGLNQQLAQLKVKVELAKTTYQRKKRLWDQKIGSEIQYLEAKTNYKSQVESLNQLKKQLSKSIIRAPFDGIIDDVIKEQGTVVGPGVNSQIFRIINLRDMYVETEVPESYINSIKKGKKVEVEFPVLGKSISSKIRQAGNFINPTNRSFKVQISVLNKDKSIKPNLTAKLKVNDYSNPKAIVIPQSIISENGKGEQYVYIVTNIKNHIGIAKQIIVKTGKTQNDVIEVLSGIEKGMHIVKEGARSVENNQEVKILNSF